MRRKGIPGHLRAQAVQQLPRFAPQTTLFKETLKNYDKLPARLRWGFAQAAAQMPKAPESEAFVIRALQDAEGDMRHMRSNILYSLGNRPPSPALREAVMALAKDKQMAGAVKHVLMRWDRQNNIINRVVHALVPTVDPVAYKREVESLKEAAWHKADPVDKHLTWYGLKPGLAIADAKAMSVTRYPGLLGNKETTVAAVALGPKKVWLGTDQGLIAWDRKTRAFSLFVVGETYVDVPVTKLDLKDNALAVTIAVKGAGERAFVLDLVQLKWSAAAQ